MSEKLRQYNPEDDDGQIIEISSTLRGPSVARVTVNEEPISDAEQESDNDNRSGVKLLEYHPEPLDPFSLEGLDKIKLVVSDWFRQINEYRMQLEEAGINTGSTEQFYQSTRSLVSVVNEMIRELRNLTESEDEELVDAKAEAFSKNLTLLQEMVDMFISGDLAEINPATENKNGWWDKEFQKEQGVEAVGAEGELKQVWGDQEGPIGFEPQAAEGDGESERTGWWNEQYLEQNGIEKTSLGELNHVQSGDDGVIVNSDLFVSRPVEGGRQGQVKWSLNNPEELFTEPEKAKATSPFKRKLLSSTNLANVGDFNPEFDKTEQGLIVGAEFENYGNARQAWLEAKTLHEIKQVEYLTAVDEYYKNWVEEVKGKSFFEKNVTKFRSMFGFRPDLPPEILALRDDAQASAELQHRQSSDELLTKRGVVGKKAWEDVSDSVKERYYRRFSYEYKVDQKEEQLKIQRQAIEQLGFEPNKFTSALLKNKNYVKVLGAAAVGAATGALVPAGAWAVRSIVGAGAAAGAAGYVNDKLMQKTEAWKNENVAAQVAQIVENIKNGNLTKEDIVEQNKRLDALFDKLDEKTRKDLYLTLGVAAVVGAAAGGAAGAIGAEVFGVGATAEIAETSEPSSAAVEVAKSQEVPVSAEAASEADTVTEVAEKSSEHTVEKKDTMWGYLKQMGYSDAETMKVINGLNEAQLKEVGFGIGSEIDADRLMAGATVDLEKLEMFAESITEPGEAVAEEIDVDTAPANTPPDTIASDSVIPPAKTSALETNIPGKGVVFDVRPENIHQFAVNYPKGGFSGFEADLQNNFISKIQGPEPRPNFLAALFGVVPEKANACIQMTPYTVGEIRDFANVGNEAKYEAFLTEHNIARKDFDAWQQALAAWEGTKLVKFNDETNFGDAVRGAFAAQTLNTPTNIT